MRRILLSLCAVAFVLQVYINPEDDNLIAAGCAMAAFVSTCVAIVNRRNSDIGRAFTGTAVFFIVAANSLAPLIGISVAGNSLASSLLHPVDVYLHRFIFALVLICSHELVHSFLFRALYGAMSRLGARVKTNILIPASFVWGIGIIGFAAHLIKHLNLPVELVKTLDGFGFLLWAPFVLLLPPYSYQRPRRLLYWSLGGFYILQVGVSLAGNSRMAMIGPIAVIAAAWMVTFLMGLIVVNGKLIVRFCIIGIVAILIGSQLRDVSTAILIERASRDDRGMGDQLSATLDRFLDKELLRRYRKEIEFENQYLSATDDWKENYLNNDFIDRFIQIRVDDNSFDRVFAYSEQSKSDLKTVSWHKVLALFPDPLLRLFNVQIDKLQLNSYSTGDLIEVLSGRGETGYFRTGSVVAHAYALFGWWYPLILLLLYTLIFSIFQGLLSIRSQFAEAGIQVSTLALILAFRFFNDISLDGVGLLFGMLLRGVWQTILIYFFCICLIRIVKARPGNSLQVMPVRKLQ